MSRRPLNILQVLRAPVGGLFRHVVDLSHGLAERGHRVGLVIDAGDAGPFWQGKIDHLETSAVLGLTRLTMARGPSPRDLLAVSHVMHRIARQKIDIVHGHGAKGGALARFAASLARKGAAPARFYTPHGGTLHFSPTSLQGRAYRAAEAWLSRHCEAVIFESAFAREGFASRFHLASPHWPVIPNGLHRHEFMPVVVPDGAADFVFIGEMRDIKGVDIFLSAMRRLPGATRAVLVGAGPQLSSYQAMAKACHLDERVEFLPPRAARAAFALGRVVVAPSRAESLPYLLLEAIAAGRPVIATAVGGVPEIFSPHTEALVPAEDSEALSAAMLAALLNPATLAATMSEIASYINNRFAVHTMVDAIEGLYCSKLAQERCSAA